MSVPTTEFLVADATKLPFEDKSFDVVIGSPPYCDARTYGIGAQRDCAEWVEWMLTVTTEALRVSRGAVVWVAAGVTRDWTYWPACEGLMWEWWKRGGSMFRPVYWHRVGIPGSGGEQWFRADVEYCMCFKRDGRLPWSENTAMGHVPKWAPGGSMSNRTSDGRRVNQWGHSIDTGGVGGGDIDNPTCGAARPSHVLAKKRHTKSRANGSDEIQNYAAPAIANPGNMIQQKYTAEEVAAILAENGDVVHVEVGGGIMGDSICHKNEAPYPEDLAEFFIRSLCPPLGRVLDPFSGSGTTVATALKCGRNGVGTDIRESQIELGRKRVRNVTPPLFIELPKAEGVSQ